MKNGYSCIKNKNSTTCILCPYYKRAKCPGALEANLFRQGNKGSYEFYYPLQQTINSIASILMISTKDILKILSKEYDLKIDRTALFKYYKDGLIDKEQKIGKGRGKGVKTYWSNKTPIKIASIRKIIKEGITVGELIKYHDILYKFKNAEILKNYRPKLMLLDNKILKISKNEPQIIFSNLDVAKFHIATYYFAVAEADAIYAFKKPIEPFQHLGYIVAIGYDADDPDKSAVVTYIYNEEHTEWAKKVEFRKGGPKVINLQ